MPCSPQRLLAEKVPLLCISAGSAWITWYAQNAGGAVGSTILLPPGLRVKNAIYSYLAYVLKGLWPTRLAVFYPHPENSLATWKVAAGGLFLVAVTALVWRYRGKKYLVAGWLWYLIALVPVIGIVQVGRQAMADRYAYIPFVGLFVSVVWLVGESARARLSSRIVATLAAVVFCGYAYATHVQLRYWQNSYTLFSHALQVTSRNGIAEDNFGVALVERGRPDLALPHFEAALNWMPRLSTAHYNLGVLLHRQNELGRAVAEYQLALAYTTEPVEAARVHNNLGLALSQLNQPAAAIAEYAEAIRINPYEYNSLLGRGLLEYRSGDVDAAQADFSRASQIAPSAVSLFWLGRTSEDRGDLGSAAAAYEAALKLAPAMQDARTHLDRVRLKAQN